MRNDAEHYDEICEKNRINGRKGGKKRSDRLTLMHSLPTASMEAVHSFSEAVGAKEKEKENEKENEKEKEKEKDLSLLGEGENIYPSLEDVIFYVQEAGLKFVDAQHFTDYYTSVGWVCGDKPMKDWRAMVRLWDKRAQKDSANAPKPVEEILYGDIL